ncbi:MAG: hypothetical protein M3R00_07640 [Pseudomonadota bacterium]|nr:hypothetical protein [Pseudomonadota bacterium]
MFRINLAALDHWTLKRKVWILSFWCCLTFCCGFILLIMGPRHSLQHAEDVYRQTLTTLHDQRDTLQRDLQHLTARKESKRPTPTCNIPPFSALKQCAITEFNWQQLLANAAGQGRPLYSLSLALQYEQAICLLTAMETQKGQGYLQKMQLEYQPEQPALTLQLDFTSGPGT